VGFGRVWAEIDLGKLVDNYKKIKHLCLGAKIMAPIKADAYGHGAIEVGQTLERTGIYMFGVASVGEGIELRKCGIRRPILVLSPIPFEEIDAIFEYNLRPTITDISFLDILEDKMRFRRRKLPVHIEVDTGMTRTGLPYDIAFDIICRISSFRNFTVEGIFTHFPSADTDTKFSRRQVSVFEQLKNRVTRSGIRPKLYHIANTAGIINKLNGRFNLARPGIALFGLLPSAKIHNLPGLKPILELKTMIVNIRDVSRGIPISYGPSYRTKRRSRIATLSVGYGDGYPRYLSNIGEVLIKGKRAKIVGSVCMDLMMVDITHIPNVSVNDIATLIGREGGNEITAQELAGKAHTIIYEIICGIGPRVPRVYYYKNRFIRVRNLFLRGLI